MSENTVVHICIPHYTAARLSRCYCPVCKRRTFVAAFFADWYGWDVTCLRCGDRWQDGEMCPRPFKRGWREASRQSAREHWRRARKAGLPSDPPPPKAPRS